MKNQPLLIIAGILIVIGFFKPDLSSIIPNNSPVVVNPSVEFNEPTNPKLLSEADKITAILREGDGDQKEDGMKLATLYQDIAQLISLDGDGSIVKTTSEIREVNSVAGTLINAKLKGKYPNLASTAKGLVVSALGDDVAVLNDENRKSAVEAFEALAWGCYMGAK
jgi:hypothetical protein